MRVPHPGGVLPGGLGRVPGAGAILLSAGLAAAASPGLLGAQEATEGAATPPDTAAPPRGALERPPPEPPFDFLDAVALPFRVATFPLHLLEEGVAWGLSEITLPRPPGFLVRGYRKMVGWGAEPAFTTSVGSRSSPGLEMRISRWSPFFLEGGYSLRESQEYRAGVRQRGPGWNGALLVEFDRDAAPKFWGVGPDSRPADESVYLRDRILVAARGRLAATEAVRLEAGAGYEDNRVGRAPGEDALPDVRERFDREAIYGLGERTRYWWVTTGATLDLTRWEGLQRRGFLLRGGSRFYFGSPETDSDFHRFTGEGVAYLSLNRRQQLAVRGLAEVDAGDAGEGVPFYHLASMGDERGNRGYSENRFRDESMLAVQAEWRWELWRELQDRARLESFLFVDHGAVGESFSELDGSDFRTSWGFGWRSVLREGGPWGWWQLSFSEEETRLRGGFGTAF